MEEKDIINRLLDIIRLTDERIDIVHERLKQTDRNIAFLYVITTIQSIAIGAIAMLALR